MKWYKRDPDAALTGMRGLSHDAKSAYGTIIDLSYSRDGDLPDDEHLLCIHIECRPQWWRRVKAELIAHRKIRIISGKLVANRVETALKEAANYHETQSKLATNGWVSRKKYSDINGHSMPYTTTTTSTSTSRSIESSLCKEGRPPAVNWRDKGNDYRAPPAGKSDNPLTPLPDKQHGKPMQKPSADKPPSSASKADLAAIYAAKHGKPPPPE